MQCPLVNQNQLLHCSRCPVAVGHRRCTAVQGVPLVGPCHQAPQRAPLTNRGSLPPPRRLRSALQAQATAQNTALPPGFVRYETMIVMRPTLTDEERDQDLAKFEAMLKKEDARDINALVRGNQPLAYPIKGHWDGIYVLYTYGAHRSTSPKVQKYLSIPPIGGEVSVLRHMTFCA